MSSPDNHTPWGTPQPPSGAAGGPLPPFTPGPSGPQPPFADQQYQSSSPQDPGQPAPPPMAPPGSPAPPPMMSPYGVPLNDGGPEGPGGFGPGDRDPGDLRRRRTLIASALAVVAVVGIGGAVAFMSGGSPHKKPDAASLAGAGVGASESGSSNAGNGSGELANGGGKPDGDDMAAGSTNGAQGAALPGDPTTTSGGQQSQSTNGGASSSAPGGGTSTHPGSPTTSHSGVPAPSNPATSAPKPSTPVTTAPAPKTTTTAAAKPSSDCTYLDLPASQMPDIKQGTTNTNAVKQLQCLLKKSELGIKPLAIDGSWGSDTQSALTAFQGCNNSPTVHSPGGTPPYPKLAVDGDAGPQTWADLYFWDNQYFNGTAYYCNGTR